MLHVAAYSQQIIYSIRISWTIVYFTKKWALVQKNPTESPPPVFKYPQNPFYFTCFCNMEWEDPTGFQICKPAEWTGMWYGGGGGRDLSFSKAWCINEQAAIVLFFWPSSKSPNPIRKQCPLLPAICITSKEGREMDSEIFTFPPSFIVRAWG